MNDHKKLNLVKSFETVKSPYHRRFSYSNHHVRFNLLGDLFFNEWQGKYYVQENETSFTFSSWDALEWQERNDLEQTRRCYAPSNSDVMEWCNKLTHNRWAQMRKISKMKSNHLWCR